MQHWYVYYKLPRAEYAETAARVGAMLDEIARTTSVRTRLLRRTGERSDDITLMEQYERIADPQRFAAELDEALRGAALPADVVAQRRVEKFEEI